MLGSFLLALVLIEIAVRIGGWAPQIHVIEIQNGVFRTTDNPDLPYIPNPGRDVFNAYGIRDEDRPIERPEGVERIVVIGDSVVFGRMLSREELFPQRLAEHLRARGGRYADLEVWNLGVPGYSTVNEVEFFKLKGLPLEPSVVVVGYCLNDSWLHSYQLRQLVAHPDHAEHRHVVTALQRNAFLRSHLVRLVVTRLEARGQGAEQEPYVASFDEVKRGFDELKRLSEQHGFQVLVVVFPYVTPFTRYQHHGEHRTVERLATQAGLLHLDLLPAFADSYGDDVAKLQMKPGDPIHINAAGHDLAAATTARFLAPHLFEPQ
jgi:lysophospholipase L1-like esterase